MSGHSKWANIKHRKARGDAARGKIFTKIGREIAVAVKSGGSDPSSNARLRDAVAKARQNNIPNDNIKRSIEKAAGAGNSADYAALTYEGYGAGGIAVIVEALTDNKNRTTADVRHAFDKYGGSLGTAGCVSYMFDKKGVIAVETDNPDALMMTALDAGADDCTPEDGAVLIYTAPENLSAVRENLENAGVKILSAEAELIPQNTVVLAQEHSAKFNKMLEVLEDNDDVQNIFHNGELNE